MKRYAVLLILVCTLGVLLPTQAQDDPHRITRENADQVISLGIVLQTQATFRGAIAPDWSYAVIGLSSAEGDFQVWDMQTGVLRYAVAAQHKVVSCFDISPDGSLIATGSADGTIQFWNAADGSLQSTLVSANLDWAFASVVFSPDGTQLAASSGLENTIQIWDVASGDVITTMNDSADVWTVHFSPDGSMLVGGSQWRGTRVWDVATGEIVLEIPPTNGAMFESAWTPDSDRLVTGCPAPHGTLCLWDVASGEMVWQTTNINFPDVRTLAFNDDGSLLLSSAPNTTGIILDAATGSTLHQLDIYYNNWTAVLAWSPDNTRAASIAPDGTLRLWGLPAGTVPASLVTLTWTPTGTTTYFPPTWTPEYATYTPTWTATYTPTPQPSVTPLPALHIGGRARVHVINNEALNVRSEPVVGNNLVEVLFDGEIVTLLEGPTTSNGLVWWRIRTPNNVEGWAVESANGVQTLIPLPE